MKRTANSEHISEVSRTHAMLKPHRMISVIVGHPQVLQHHMLHMVLTASVEGSIQTQKLHARVEALGCTREQGKH